MKTTLLVIYLIGVIIAWIDARKGFIQHWGREEWRWGMVLVTAVYSLFSWGALFMGWLHTYAGKSPRLRRHPPPWL